MLETTLDAFTALAMTQGWALRELTWRRPSLEELFTQLVIGTLDEEEKPRAKVAPEASAELAPAAELPLAGQALPLGTPGTAAQKTIYSLNPFDRGASRDLSKPVSIDAPAPPPDGGEEPGA